MLNQGISPVKAEDPEVDPMIRRVVLEKKTLIATYNNDCLKLADCVVVDVQCDYSKQELGNMRSGDVENSFRATTLAFLNERSLFSERSGVDLIKVIDAIKLRPTHSNMIFPGPGIAGYCLPKDAGLGYWAYKHILGFDDGDEIFKITPAAIDINDTRGLHVATLTRDALRNMGRYIAGADVLICGASATART
jgi:hypothetical protein